MVTDIYIYIYYIYIERERERERVTNRIFNLYEFEFYEVYKAEKTQK